MIRTIQKLKKTKFVIEGGHGLVGEIETSGSKNSALSVLSASLVGSGESVLKNVPLTSDVHATIQILKKLDVKTGVYGKNILKVNADSMNLCDVPQELTNRTRASILLLGALLAKVGKARIGFPGGDNIGRRSLDLHLKGLRALGANVRFGEKYIEAKARKLRGTYIFLDYPSSTATELLLIVASLAEGITVIDNAETKPEIIDLANYLRKMGARISGAGTSSIKIKGVRELTGSNHSVIPDYLEACTFMIASAITKGNVYIRNVIPNHLRPAIAKLQETGVQISKSRSSLHVETKNKINAINIVATKPYPGLSSDVQPLFVSLLTKAKGISTVRDLVFENRFLYTDELKKMGADITAYDSGILIRGVDQLKGVPVTASDIRGGAALILAGLTAEGETEINGAHHIDRGYEKIEEKLTRVGAKIRKE